MFEQYETDLAMGRRIGALAGLFGQKSAIAVPQGATEWARRRCVGYGHLGWRGEWMRFLGAGWRIGLKTWCVDIHPV
ncbi:hypothetical protein [Denitromonas iodatirespirans]|uniref:hypothetical protein n=1 Tax=Denitromonas iodatirespirans TaxID=2795389 RepID=UPI001E460E76|nr:hypothetical protein [Denitromonas iodatirespirans]